MTQLPRPCPLCHEAGGTLVWQNPQLRVIAVDEPSHPGFTRVIWQDHITEMTQLPSQARNHFMEAVWLVEQVQRQMLQPDKINLAQFGNMVPHLHWHIIPRWADDSHFPEAIWAAAPLRTPEQKTAWVQHKANVNKLLPQYWAALQATLQRNNIGITPKS
ncbi:HIT family protein [Pollutimonas harenae]|uniref:HIT family protein n=1 Tax=Pollutimonas harenae TaxID=657015 RepID=A0A853GXT8_9BURK|nr:HIT family protein [Pollutimonas harenae]NYT84942.1 HIT family protein [Pollutimonas harenae]TEA72666.1 HIT family protein [Pollutimonas harenae]